MIRATHLHYRSKRGDPGRARQSSDLRKRTGQLDASNKLIHLLSHKAEMGSSASAVERDRGVCDKFVGRLQESELRGKIWL
jgi:hypothetical protein